MNDIKENENLQINKEDEENNEYRKKNNFIKTPQSTSSSSSSCSEISVDDMTNLQEEEKNDSKKINNTKEVRDYLRCRSKSDGGQSLQSPNEPFEVFPSLPLEVLEKMELIGSDIRDRLGEEEIEQKFISLSLAFKIDTATIKDRCERQRHYRDQTENNLAVEIEKLIEKITHIQPLCVNLQTTELLNSLLEQADIIMNASNHATISAERYGAVQYEERLSESVNLMINYVDTLKHQRDSARRYLQYTKKVLQESHNNNNNNNETSQNSKQRHLPINGKSMTKRRASIATISEPRELTTKILHETKKIIRRTSDYALKTSISARTSRPSRLELGVDLVKIKEGVVDETPNEINQQQEEIIPEEEPKENDLEHITDAIELTISSKLLHRIQKVSNKVNVKYREWIEDNTLHDFFNLNALLCFSLSVIIILNIFIELKCSNDNSTNLFCKLSSNNLIGHFYNNVKK